jgi:hypothetical protein
MKLLLLACLTLAVLVATAGCGRPFDVKTPPEMIELKDQDPPFAYRAMTPDGVVVAVRVVDDDRKTDLAFWENAIRLRMKELAGYALLRVKDITSRDGTKGKELRFGHDENGKPYVYRVRVLVAQGRVFVVEAGGAKAQMDRYDSTVGWTLDNVKVKCGGFLYPVLSSHTCNRW